jgi:hypothetical protein
MARSIKLASGVCEGCAVSQLSRQKNMATGAIKWFDDAGKQAGNIKPV